MANYNVALKDASGLSFRVSLSLPFLKNGTYPFNSTWRVLDTGFLRFSSGGCQMVDTTPGTTFTHGNLLLCVPPYIGTFTQYYGVTLTDFVDSVGLANDSGSGVVHQPWAANCKPGQITWRLLEYCIT